MAYLIIFCGTGSDGIQKEKDIVSDLPSILSEGNHLSLSGPFSLGGGGHPGNRIIDDLPPIDYLEGGSEGLADVLLMPLGLGFGFGVGSNVDLAIQEMARQYEKGERVFNWAAWSRGSATAIATMRRIDRLGGLPVKNKVIPRSNFTVNAFLCDPVAMYPGRLVSEFMLGGYKVLPSFDNVHIIYASADTALYFPPMTFNMAHSSHTNLTNTNIPGTHREIVTLSHPCGKYAFLLMHQFLNKHGTKTPTNPSEFELADSLSKVLLLDLYRSPFRSMFLPHSMFPNPLSFEIMEPIIQLCPTIHRYTQAPQLEILERDIDPLESEISRMLESQQRRIVFAKFIKPIMMPPPQMEFMPFTPFTLPYHNQLIGSDNIIIPRYRRFYPLRFKKQYKPKAFNLLKYLKYFK